MLECVALQFLQFSKHSELSYGVSEAKDGTMRLSAGGAVDAVSHENRAAYFGTRRIAMGHIVSADLVHGNKVVVVGEREKGGIVPSADALVTNQKGVYLAVTVADCFPVFLYDSDSHAIGMVHAGWRGIIGGVVANALRAMQKHCGSDPRMILAGVGPGIRACHFAFPQDACDVFGEYSFAIEKQNGIPHVDLPAIIRRQLFLSGVKESNVESAATCTYCAGDQYFSYRRRHAKDFPAMVAYIGMMGR